MPRRLRLPANPDQLPTIQRTVAVAWLLLLTSLLGGGLTAQRPGLRYDYTQRDPLALSARSNWLTPAAELDRKRFRTGVAVGTGLYAGFSVGLYQAWYNEYGLGKFHVFNDWRGWEQMDKAGHVFTAYFFSRSAFAGLRWAGLKRPAARYAAFGVANLLQGTIEAMDGFSEEWGFSWGDMGANVAGSLVFSLQDALWHEQRILIKVSSDLRPPPDVEVVNGAGQRSNLGTVSRDRFGSNPFERFLKDYNAQTIWLSVNPKAFAPRSFLPDWLNIAVGYGAEDVYGALFNSWSDGGDRFRYRPERYRQWFLSPDLYLSRIPTRKRWVRVTLGILDFIKVPAPTLEYSKGRFRGRWLM